MKKFINDPRNFVNEMIEGILFAHPGKLKCINNDLRCLVRADKIKEGKVGIMTGGGCFWVMSAATLSTGPQWEVFSNLQVQSRCIR